MRIRIENVTLVTTDEANRVFENGCLVWEDDTILALNDFSMHVDEVIDGQGGLLLPGMVNTHCHLGMIPFRSLGDDCPDRLRRFLFPLENAAMTRELAQAFSGSRPEVKNGRWNGASARVSSSQPPTSRQSSSAPGCQPGRRRAQQGTPAISAARAALWLICAA